MIENIVIGGVTLAALQSAVFDATSKQARAQAKAFGLADLKARGYEVKGCE